MQQAAVVSYDDDLVAVAPPEDRQQFLCELGFRFGHTISPERALALAECIDEWTVRQTELALRWIPKQPQLAKQVSYERTIGPVLLALASEHPQIMAGRLHPYHKARLLASVAGVPIPQLFEATHVRGPDGELERPPRWRLTDPATLSRQWTPDGWTN